MRHYRSRLVSVVVPAFNRSSTIRAALESICRQTYGDWEAIVVNDGSIDDTGEAVRQSMKQDSRIRLIEHGNRKGAQAARNTALRAARGEWIAFLDSDDQWLPQSLELRIEAANKGAHVVHSECYILEPEEDPQLFGVPALRGQIYRELLRSPGPMFQGLMLSKEACLRLGPLDESIVAYQEWDTSIRLAKHYEFEYVAVPTFIYDCRHANTISKDSVAEAVGYEQVVKKHRWAILRYLGPESLSRHYEQAASLYMSAKQEVLGRRCWLRAAMLWPFRLSVVSTAKSFLAHRLSQKLVNAHRNSS